jgi:hypothetical protein
MKIEILQELKSLGKLGEKEYKKGGSFRPFKYYKYENGKNIPTYFVGSPGLYVAIVTTLVVVATFYLITIKFNIWIWLMYVIITAFLVRLAVKMDKARQIRSLVYAISSKAVAMLEEYNKSQNIDYLKNAKELLYTANNWVEEPVFMKQIDLIDEKLK